MLLPGKPRQADSGWNRHPGTQAESAQGELYHLWTHPACPISPHLPQHMVFSPQRQLEQIGSPSLPFLAGSWRARRSSQTWASEPATRAKEVDLSQQQEALEAVVGEGSWAGLEGAGIGWWWVFKDLWEETVLV